ncbi:hypothetical protein EXU48_08660 [Occultella glacieicola]|uniref:Uncharacterized protein n=1 Tax=Occultella glacieicola TaxID=2518684 RepID=A0ABY2E5G5_9MICO|nr:hypothetical protein EXU48_08660 [Occultella glacieicola]
MRLGASGLGGACGSGPRASAALRFGGSAASAALRFGGSAARRLCGSGARRLEGCGGPGPCGSAAARRRPGPRGPASTVALGVSVGCRPVASRLPRLRVARGDAAGATVPVARRRAAVAVTSRVTGWGRFRCRLVCRSARCR